MKRTEYNMLNCHFRTMREAINKKGMKEALAVVEHELEQAQFYINHRIEQHEDYK